MGSKLCHSIPWLAAHFVEGRRFHRRLKFCQKGRWVVGIQVHGGSDSFRPACCICMYNTCTSVAGRMHPVNNKPYIQYTLAEI